MFMVTDIMLLGLEAEVGHSLMNEDNGET